MRLRCVATPYPKLKPVVIAEPGWYPFRLIYFEKRVTSTVELYWKPPGGSGDMDFVPEEAFAHTP